MHMQEAEENTNREATVVRTSITAIIANIALASMKAIVGAAANSVAITTDAVNNLSDALSSIITIVGTKLAGKRPDHKHPFGYGRIEFLTAMIIAFIVLYAGITALVESIRKIISPEPSDYSTIALILLAVGILVKIFLGRYVKGTGERINSDSLIASGADAMNDAILSSAVLVSALINRFSGLSLEAWFSAVLSVFILKSGLEMLRETLNDILGTRADPELSKKVKQVVVMDPDVYGAYDLFLDAFGPDHWRGSLHVEVPDTLTAHEIDVMTRRVTMNVLNETGVLLTAIGIYSVNGPENAIRNDVSEIIKKYDEVLQMHGFFADEEKKYMSFDVVISWREKDPHAYWQRIYDAVKSHYPDYDLHIQRDNDMSD